MTPIDIPTALRDYLHGQRELRGGDDVQALTSAIGLNCLSPADVAKVQAVLEQAERDGWARCAEDAWLWDERGAAPGRLF